MIGIVDYGMGNLRSVQKALQAVGADARIYQRPEDLAAADKIVLPGVGAMQPAMQRLTELGLTAPIKAAVAAGKPFLGICLGFQLLFESSSEGGTVPGLGILPGTVERFSSLKVPHMGWNQIRINPTARCGGESRTGRMCIFAIRILSGRRNLISPPPGPTMAGPLPPRSGRATFMGSSSIRRRARTSG